jgi:hypothetical protein
MKSIAKPVKIIKKQAAIAEFKKNSLSSAYRLVYEGNQDDYYGDSFPCKIYELEPHVKTVKIYNFHALKGNRDKFYTLAFPYLQFTIYKKTLYATISKTSFVSPDYVGLHDMIFNHFLYGYICLPYERIATFDSDYGLINQFYSTGNRVGENPYGTSERLTKWELESKTPSKVMYSNSVLWQVKSFSLTEMLTSSYEKPHQDGGYGEYYTRPRFYDNHFQSYNPLSPYKNNQHLRKINKK